MRANTANIGPYEAAKRRNHGTVMVIVAVAIEAAFVSAEASQWWRLVLLPVVYLALSGVLQSREKT